MLITIRLGRTMYKIKPENEARIMEGYAKAAKTKRKPITAGCGRKFPRFGAELSTHDYVRDYFAMNAPGVYCGTRNQAAALEAGNAALDMFEPLSKHISVPQGFDSVEVEV
jgi:hypothetical protein